MLVTNRWDLAYQYELNKVAEFWELTLPGSLSWDYNTRPCNQKGVVGLDQIDLHKDTLVLHFDDNCLGPSHLGKEEKENWSEVFRALSELPFSKTVFVCHGAPPRQDRFNPSKFFEKELPLDEEALYQIRNIVGDRIVVMPSEVAKASWGFQKSIVIEPSMEPIHFPFSLQRVNRGLIIHPAPTADPHGSGYHNLKVVSTQLPVDLYGVDSLNEFPSIVPQTTATNNSEAYHRWYQSLDLIAQRNFCLDLQDANTASLSTLTAMLCGLPVIGNGIWNGDLIRQGVTGYASIDLHEIRNYIVFLLKNPDISLRLGKQARRYALDKRPFDGFAKKWRGVL